MRHVPLRAAAIRMLRDGGGVAAVEFALILPLMLLLYVGVIDVTRYVIASRKLSQLSRTVSDLVSQQPTASGSISIAGLSNIFAASSAVMAPYPTGTVTLTVSAVDIKAKSNATCCDALVRWSFTQSGTLRACTTPLVQVSDGTPPLSTNFPISLITANQAQSYGYTTGAVSYVIVADAAYTYTPIFAQALAWFSGPMTKTTFMVPRASTGPVTIADPSGALAPQSGRICFN